MSLVIILVAFPTHILPCFAYDMPIDLTNPICVNSHNLSAQTNPHIHKERACGCKTCELDIMTFGQLNGYVDKIKDDLDSANVVMNKVRRDINSKNTWLKSTYAYKYLKKTSLRSVEDDINIKDRILRDLDAELAIKQYKNTNYLLVAKNRNPNDPTVRVLFLEDKNLQYDMTSYDELFFKKIKEKVKDILKNKDQVISSIAPSAQNQGVNFSKIISLGVVTLAVAHPCYVTAKNFIAKRKLDSVVKESRDKITEGLKDQEKNLNNKELSDGLTD